MNGGLDAFAAISVDCGVNLQPGQVLVVSAPLEAAGLVRLIAGHAYDRGAAAVVPIFDDPALIRLWIDRAEAQVLADGADGLAVAAALALDAGAARLSVLAPRPELLAGIDAGRLAQAHQVLASGEMLIEAALRRNQAASCAVPFATESWAQLVFPNLAPPVAVDALWSAIFEATRLDAEGTGEPWRAHIDALSARRGRLQGLQFDALRLYDGETDLTLGLARDHR